MEKHKTFLFEGRQLHYRDEGRNNTPTLVLLHGFLQNLSVWSKYVLTYMNDMRVITIDLPGHGYSDNFCPVHKMSFMARAVEGVLIEAAVQECVIIGHSMGGYVALEYAHEHPEQIRGLGLINSLAFGDSDEQRLQRVDACKQVSENRPNYIINYIPKLFDNNNQQRLMLDINNLKDEALLTKTESIVAAQKGMLQRESRMAVIRDLRVPTFFVYGKNDTRIELDYAIVQAMQAQCSEIHLLNNVGHMAHFEALEYLKPRIGNFVLNCYR